jgi:hypothetical protein
MGRKDDMAANPPGSDDEDAEDEAVETAYPDNPAAGHEPDKDDDPNLIALSAQLRGLYKGLLDEPVPDRFAQLLKELENKEAEKK